MIASHRFAKSGTVSRLHRWTGTVLAAGALGVAAVAGSGTAAALSSEDDMFLSEISADGIAYDTPKAAIGTAHDVCSRLDGGADPVDLGLEILDDTDLTVDQVATFVVASVDHYCPRHVVLFG
ncbi:hypothetical protein AU184_13860 [Mycolicibacterium novocastrense]|uniref:DUF732 domain-containing protein n=1 Tax=Mycolicibacterium novocastrense TaxID=59813 RepID=A0AAW5SE93_MYCNV|nr:DUF732 domain-containing protein [Mycolicibacterium novocastrense]KUH69903.1 hypothetical protein AU183_10175 [Mycolicibacterium novocastrense]KUH78076.1 hypothetical protein AU072_08940 [Mycolicibacterium novocastrense]KUH79411.1 hypothetical protein AU184_13860 [Mycolicibacterium novocastrense]MCV7022529.1 DUF732 domain-containing protein [Mycolicibacterium novocastrense]GAT08194.1 uncharacterized protein RMCN_1327 [Mycolicibacterium novocastrense]